MFVAILIFFVVALSALGLATNAQAANKHCVCPPFTPPPGCVAGPYFYSQGNKLYCLVECDIDVATYVPATCR